MSSSNQADKSVVGVCGSQARVYGPIDKETNRRPLKSIIDFPHYGAAVLFAQEFEDDKRSH